MAMAGWLCFDTKQLCKARKFGPRMLFEVYLSHSLTNQYQKMADFVFWQEDSHHQVIQIIHESHNP